MAHATLPDNAVEITSRAAWRAWLKAHHTRTTGIWLVTYKKSDAERHVPYGDVVEEALCFGWIDSKPQKLDAARSMLWLAPRKPRTNWSGLNKRRVEALIASGQMMPSGLAKIAAARADGSWAALDTVEALEIPPDLRAAFKRHTGSAAQFAAFPPSTRRGILEWILNAKRPETRATRVEETATLAARGERANQWTRK
jgi:uncharacterized protein YdeI (YjbR/CyaY-like superfamily)